LSRNRRMLPWCVDDFFHCTFWQLDRGVDSFQRHSPNCRVVQNFYLPSQKTTGQKLYKDAVKGKIKPCQTGERVCIFNGQFRIQLTFGELAHPWLYPITIWEKPWNGPLA
jgi:hypothetical protein